jgi:hypothetical protein
MLKLKRLLDTYVDRSGMRRDRVYMNLTYLFAAAKWLNCHFVVQREVLNAPDVFSWRHFSPDSHSRTNWQENDQRPTLLIRLRRQHILCVKQLHRSSSPIRVCFFLCS